MRILVVDDDPVLLAWCCRELRSRGCEVWEASGGDEGWYLYRRNGPWDFVLTDFEFIPGVDIGDGLQLVRAIQAKNPRQRVAIHTSSKTLEAPVPVLRKPYRVRQLLHLLRAPLVSLATPKDIPVKQPGVVEARSPSVARHRFE